jgi:hypothetical protein
MEVLIMKKILCISIIFIGISISLMFGVNTYKNEKLIDEKLIKTSDIIVNDENTKSYLNENDEKLQLITNKVSLINKKYNLLKNVINEDYDLSKLDNQIKSLNETIENNKQNIIEANDINDQINDKLNVANSLLN